MSNKTVMTVAATALAAIAIGCKSIPTDSQMYTTSYAVGVSTGLIADMTKIDDTARNAVINIMGEVEMCVPETNQTFAAAWNPIALAHISKLVESGRITKEEGVMIAKVFNVAVDGIDYLFTYRYPKAKQYQDLVSAATHGFCNGFLAVFKPANGTFSASKIEYDVEAYKYLQSKWK